LPVARPDVDDALRAMATVRRKMTWEAAVGKSPAEALGAIAGVVRREPLKRIAKPTA
jgi:S-adenosylmethionine synthetase